MKKVVYVISDINKALAFEWISENVDKKRIELSFILLIQGASELEVYLSGQGIPCYTFCYHSRKDLLKVFNKVYRKLKQLKPDVVHCHLLYGSIIGLSAAKVAGITKRIYTRHHSDYHHRYFPKGIKWDKLCNWLATDIIAPSGTVQEILVNYEQVAPQKVSLIHHGFDVGYFKEVPSHRVQHLKSKYRTEGRDPVIGVISRFTELKGIQYIIPAFAQLLKLYPKATLMLFNATGDYIQQIQKLLAEIPSENYRLIKFENDLAAAYKLFDVFVQVSTDQKIEAFGQTYVEALASGIPSVFTLSGIASDFIENGKNAYVVPFRNSDVIFHKIKAILDNKAEAYKMAMQGQKDVSSLFSLSKMIHSLEELYES